MSFARMVVLTLIPGVIGGLPTHLQAQLRGPDWSDRCESYGRRSSAKFCETRELGMRATGGRLTVDGGRNGGISVIGWDRDSIHVIAHIEASARTLDEAREVAGEIRVVQNGTEIHGEGPGRGRSIGWAVSFEIRAPRHSDFTLTTANGGVEVEDVIGTMDLEAENGPVTLVSIGGNVRARAINGPLHVSLGGSRWEGEGLDAETVNGPVSLEIPGNYSARLETGTLHGPFDTDSPLTVTLQGRRSSRITSVLGSGGPPIRAVTTNGPVQIRRS